MKLTLANEAQDTAVRNIPWVASDIPNGTSHLLFRGDLVALRGASNRISYLHWLHLGYTFTDSDGELVLADGLGSKVVQVQPVVRQIARFTGFVRSNVGSEYRLLPPFQTHILESNIGNVVMKSPTDFATIVGIVDVAGVLHYLLDKDWSLSALEEAYYRDDFALEDWAPDAITYANGNNPVFVYPSALVEVDPFWDSIYSFWKQLDDTDRAMVESIWQGLSHMWGNLMQRMYEIDASQDLFNMFIWRKIHWACINCDFRRFTGTGETDGTRPTVFIDKTRKPFTRSLADGRDIESAGSFITYNGVPYRITEVLSPSEVVCEGANFQTANGLSYSYGMQHVDDLNAGTMKTHCFRESRVLLDSVDWFDLESTNISYAEVKGLTSGGRIRKKSELYEGVLSGTTFTIDEPLFNHSFYGTSFMLEGNTYSVEDVADDGYSIALTGVSLTPGDYTATLTEANFSQFQSITFVAGSRIISGPAGIRTFGVEDVGCRLIVTGSANAAIYAITRFIDEESVEVDITAAATSTESVIIPIDAVIDLPKGLIRREEYGRIQDCATVTILVYRRVRARMWAGEEIKEVESLQEGIRDPEVPLFDICQIVAYDGVYVGHKNLITFVIQSISGEVFNEGTDYTIDKSTGILTIPGGSSISTGQSVLAMFDYTPWLGREGIDYYLEGDGYLYFLEAPSVTLWSPETYVDAEDPHELYGQLIGFYQENTESYYLSLLALWITFLTGPKPALIERGVSILLGLPFALDSGTVVSLSERRVELGERWMVSIQYDTLGFRQVELPADLQPFVGVGESVSRFDMLCGFVTEFGSSGRLRNRSFSDATQAPFRPEHVGGKLWIPFGDAAGVFPIKRYLGPSQVAVPLRTDGKSAFEEDIPYRILVPAVRTIDHVDDGEHLQRWTSPGALSRYFTQNTTQAERDLAQQLLSPHVWLPQIDGSAINTPSGFGEIVRFLRRIRPTYTDFILQILQTAEDAFELEEDGATLPNVIMDLTSRLSWFAAWLPPVTNPFDGTTLPHGYTAYKGAYNTGSPDLFDTRNAPFTSDDVGKSIWIPGAWQYFEGGAVSPTAPPDEFFVAGPDPVFAASDIGAQVEIPALGIRTAVRQYNSPNNVLVNEDFDALAIDLEFAVDKEQNKGFFSEITAYISPSHVQLADSLITGRGHYYLIVRKEDFLDDENLNFTQDVEVQVFDGAMTLIDNFTFED